MIDQVRLESGETRDELHACFEIWRELQTQLSIDNDM